MTRGELIEQVLRAVYGDQPRDDASITPNLVNLYINQGTAQAIRSQLKDSINVDGVTYINNAFYFTYKGLPISQEENLLWKVDLPQVPFGIGRNEGVANLRLKKDGKTSIDAIPISIAQKGYHYTMKKIPNRMLFYTEGKEAYILSSVNLNTYTASVTMISTGSNNPSTTVSIPDDYIPYVIDYVVKALVASRGLPKDNNNDGEDI